MLQMSVDLDLIKNQRNKLGLSQKFMADKLGLKTTEKYSRRESGTYNFQATEIPVVANVLGLPIEKIFKQTLRI